MHANKEACPLPSFRVYVLVCFPERALVSVLDAAVDPSASRRLRLSQDNADVFFSTASEEETLSLCNRALGSGITSKN